MIDIFYFLSFRRFYALLIALDTPLLVRNCITTLRDIDRTLLKIRSTLSADDERLPMLDMLICIITYYFGQYDLVED